MMRNQGNGDKKDFVQGRVYKGKKWNPETQQYVEGAFFNVALYEINEDQEPVVIGTRKIKIKGKETEVERHRIVKVFRVAESSLLKVANGESKSCNLYYSKRSGY